MSYRFVRVTDNYPRSISDFYSRNSNAHLLPYAQQYEQLVSGSFEIASSYTKNLNKIGVAAFDIISNAEILQAAWKKEHNLSPDMTRQELISKQLQFYKPQVVWIDDFSIVDEKWKADLFNNIPSVKLLVGHICAPYNSITAEKFKLFDLIFTCIPCLKKELEGLSVNVHLLYHGFETSALKNLTDNNQYPEANFLFSGSLYGGSGFHAERIEYIEKMIKAGIEMDLYCNLESRKKIRSKRGMYFTLNLLKKLGLGSLIERFPILKKNKEYGKVPINYYSRELENSSKAPVFGYEMYKLLSKAKICFNIHGGVADKCAGNIRLFEATGVGTCLVTDWKENIADLFEPGKEIVTYKTVEECIEKVKWLLANPLEREKIAKAGQKRTLENHTIEIRAKVMNDILSKELSKKD